jgi:translation initiation factor 1 (eIF-1/SUI1)
MPVPERTSRKDVVLAWTNRMQPAYTLLEVPGNRIVQIGHGKPPCVTVEVTKRQSNTFVTHVRGLEKFDVGRTVFCKEVAHRFGCAGTVVVDEKELVFQGNLADELEALLTADESLTSHGGAKESPYRLPKNSIDVVLRKGVPPRKR